MARLRFWNVRLGVMETGKSLQSSTRSDRDNHPYLCVSRSVGCPSIPSFVEQWSDQSPAFRSSRIAVSGSSGEEMESRGTFIDDRLNFETDFSGAVALGLCDISSDADSLVGGRPGHGFGRFCSLQSLIRMGSVVGVLEQVDTFLHTGESAGE